MTNNYTADETGDRLSGYNKWDYKEQVSGSQTYVPLVQLLGFLNFVRFGRKRYEDDFEAARLQLVSSQLTDLGPETRFPDGIYVNLSSGFIASNLSQMMTDLDTVQYYTLNLCPLIENDYTEAKERLLDSANILMNIISREEPTTMSVGIVNRGLFETIHNLIWR